MVFWQADKKMKIILQNGSSDLSVKNNLHRKFLNPPNPLFQRGNNSVSTFIPLFQIGKYLTPPLEKGVRGDFRPSKLFIWCLSIFISFLMGCAPSWSGKIVYLDDGKLVIQPENNEKIKSGQKLLVYRQKTITHPVTGEELGMIKDNIAEVPVTWVRNKTVTALATDPWFDMMMADDCVSAIRGAVNPVDGLVFEVGRINDVDPKNRIVDVSLINSKDVTGDKLIVIRYADTITDLDKGDILAVKVEPVAILTEISDNRFSYELADNLSWIEADDVVIKRTGDMLKESQWFQDPPDGFSETWIFKRNYLHAIRYYNNGLYKEAMLELNNVNPQYEDAGYLMGLCYMKLNRYNEAVKYYDDYLKQKKDDVRVWTLLAYMYLKQDKILDVARVYEELSKLMPDEPKIFVDLGDVYQKLGDQQKSEKAYKKALEIDPNNEEAKYELQQ
jgi:hypothetical protein